MNTETVTVHQKGDDFEITVQHDQSGSAYGITLSKNAYEQLRQHFVSGSLLSDEEIRDGADEWVFDKNGMKWSNNDNTAGDNYASFIAGAKWALTRLGNDR